MRQTHLNNNNNNRIIKQSEKDDPMEACDDRCVQKKKIYLFKIVDVHWCCPCPHKLTNDGAAISEESVICKNERKHLMNIHVARMTKTRIKLFEFFLRKKGIRNE